MNEPDFFDKLIGALILWSFIMFWTGILIKESHPLVGPRLLRLSLILAVSGTLVWLFK